MKLTFSFILCLLVATNSYSQDVAKAEVVVSCSESLRYLISKKKIIKQEWGLASAVSIGPAAIVAAAGVPVLIPIVIVGGIGAVAISLKVTESRRKNMLRLFDGAASGGNKQTLKLWDRAQKKDPDVFSKITYQDFLASIHKSDVSREACKEKSFSSKKEMIKVVKLELDEEAEADQDEAVASDQSQRGVNSKHDLPAGTAEKKKPVTSSTTQQ